MGYFIACITKCVLKGAKKDWKSPKKPEKAWKSLKNPKAWKSPKPKGLKSRRLGFQALNPTQKPAGLAWPVRTLAVTPHHVSTWMTPCNTDICVQFEQKKILPFIQSCGIYETHLGFLSCGWLADCVQSWEKVIVCGLVKFLPAVAYHFCLN